MYRLSNRIKTTKVIDMKKINNAVKYGLYILLATVFCSCNSYSLETMREYDSMYKPVILKHKEKTSFWYSVILEDGNGEVYKWGNVSTYANHIGETYNVGDTISNCR